MSVYMDIAFLVNFIFDAELLTLAHLICSKRPKPLRIMLAAVVGGAQGVLVFFPYFGILSAPPVAALIALFMAAVSIEPCRMRDFLTFYMVFLSSSFFLAGIITFIHAKTLFGILMIFPIYLLIYKIKKEIYSKRKKVTLYIGDRKIEKTAIYDSGNTVSYFGKPVIFGNSKLIYEFFGKDFAIDECQKLCVIPYKTIKGSGTVKGIRLDRAVIDKKSFDGAVLGFFDENINDEIILNGVMM